MGLERRGGVIGPTPRPLRILHVIASLATRYGGPSTAVVGLARALVARGNHVEIFTTDRGGAPEAGAVADLEVRCFPVRRPASYGVSPQLARELRARLDGFDIVHVHSLYLFHTLVACTLARRRDVPYVIRPHGTLDPYHRARHRLRKTLYDVAVERRNLRLAAGIHYVSDVERAHAEEAGVVGRGFVVPLGVDLEVFETERGVAFEQWRPDLADRTLVTFLGRISAKKGLDVLVDAFARVASVRRDAHLVLAGPDDEGLGAALRERVAERALEAQVSFLGTLGGEKVSLLQRSAVFVLPSRDENFAVAAVEAMAAGVPVILTRDVAIHRDVEEAEAGIVVERTAADVADAVLGIIDDPVRALRLAGNARALARTRFSWRHCVVDVERMYEEAMNR